MKRRMVLAVLGVVLVLQAGMFPVAADKVHIDPATVPLVFDGAALLRKYSQVLDRVLDRDVAGVESSQEQADWANIPDDLRDTVSNFLSSSQSLAQLIPGIEADLESSRAMLSQFRASDAQQSMAQAKEKLAQAYSELGLMERHARTTGRWWQAAAAAEGSDLRRAYEEMEAKLLRLRALLDLLSKMQDSLTTQIEAVLDIAEWYPAMVEELRKLLVQEEVSPEQIEAVLDIAEEDLARVEELKRLLLQEEVSPEQIETVLDIAEWYRTMVEELRKLLAQEGVSPEIVAKLDELKGLLLRPTALTLEVEPAAAFVGEPVEFRGRLTSATRPMAGRKVTVLLAGSPVAEVVTDGAGFYQGQIVLPYEYISETTIQTIYYPEGDDIGLYLGCSSPTVTIEVLYYETSLSLQAGDTAYPGRELALQGDFDYGTDPVPETRDLRLYWDGELAAEETVTTAFALDFMVTAETPLGRYRLTVYVLPQRRYAPARASADVEVVRASPIIELDAPGIVLLPLPQHIQGRVYSSLGPLEDASVQVMLGEWEAGTLSREDGTFEVRLGTGMSMTLVGAQELQIVVTPTEPWHRGASSASGLLVINPVNIAGLILVAAIPAVFGARRRKRKGGFPSVARPSPQVVAPPLVKSVGSRLLTEVSEPEVTGSPRAILLALYRGVLRLVQTVTSVLLQPSQTLREFARECAPRLGPLAGYFQEFTLIIERLLYSRHHPREADAAMGEELSQRLREGVGGEKGI